MIDPLAMPIFKPLWEALSLSSGCFAAWRGMSLGEISASAYAAAWGRRPSDHRGLHGETRGTKPRQRCWRGGQAVFSRNRPSCRRISRHRLPA